MTKLTNEELNKIREIRIHQILGVKDNGRRIMIRCPFHSDKTASFVLYPENNYTCFGCNKTGQNCIDFVIDLGFTFEESLLELIKYIK